VSEVRAYRGDTAAVNQFVASNDPHRPTVAFLGAGPRDRGDDDVTDDVTVLYVGSTFSGETEAEHAIRLYSTGISSRSLPPQQSPFQVPFISMVTGDNSAETLRPRGDYPL